MYRYTLTPADVGSDTLPLLGRQRALRFTVRPTDVGRYVDIVDDQLYIENTEEFSRRIRRAFLNSHKHLRGTI